MTSGLNTTIYPVKDITAAKAVYTALLGVEPHTDAPYYVGYTVAGHEVGLDPNGHSKGLTGAVSYWDVADIAARVDSLVAAGAELRGEITDVGGGKLIATVQDADGNRFGLLQQPAS